MWWWGLASIRWKFCFNKFCSFFFRYWNPPKGTKPSTNANMVSMTRGHLLVLGRSCGLNIHTDRQTIQVTPNIRERTSNTPATINQAENNPNKNKLHYMRMHNIFLVRLIWWGPILIKTVLNYYFKWLLNRRLLLCIYSRQIP